jgi:hypothetical protein
MEEMMNLGGDEPDLQQLARSFPTDTPRVKKRDEHYLLILESDEPRDDEVVIADGTNVLHQMVGIMLQDGPNFHRPRIRGMTKQNADGSLSHQVNVSVKMEVRISMFVTVRLIGPDGKEIEKDKGPTHEQIVWQLARDNARFRLAQVVYGALEHTWANLYKVLDVMRLAHGGLNNLKAKNYVPPQDIEHFKATANSHAAIGLDSRHVLEDGVKEPLMTVPEAQEMFRKLFQGWIEDLRKTS